MAYKQNAGGPRQSRTGGGIPSNLQGPMQTQLTMAQRMKALRDQIEKQKSDLTVQQNDTRDRNEISQAMQVSDSLNMVAGKGVNRKLDSNNKIVDGADLAAILYDNKSRDGKGLKIGDDKITMSTANRKMIKDRMPNTDPEELSNPSYNRGEGVTKTSE